MDTEPEVPILKSRESLNVCRFEPGWNNSTIEWKLPEEMFSQKRREETWEMYQKIVKFEEENKFEDQTMMFLSDYIEMINLQKEFDEKGFVKKKEEKKEEVIQLSRPIDFDDLNYVMDHYDYDPNDTVVNNYDDDQAENYIRSLVVEYRKSVGKPI